MDGDDFVRAILARRDCSTFICRKLYRFFAEGIDVGADTRDLPEGAVLLLRGRFGDLAALAAQDTVRAMNGANNTWFCGAWMRHGFHEDGLSSAVDVVRAINRTPSMQVAA